MLNLSQRKEGGGQRKKSKNELENADLSDDVHAYGIDRLNLVEPKNDSETDSK